MVLTLILFLLWIPFWFYVNILSHEGIEDHEPVSRQVITISELPSENWKPIEQNTLTFDEYVVFWIDATFIIWFALARFMLG